MHTTYSCHRSLSPSPGREVDSREGLTALPGIAGNKTKE